jgi:thiamine transport system permease protein
MKPRSLIYALPLAFLGAFFLYPLASILRLSLSGAGQASGLALIATDPYYLEVLWFSAWQAALSTLLTLALGVPAAYVFARYRFPGQALLRAVATVPFVLPTTVVAAAFTALLGPRGLVNETLQDLLGLARPPVQALNTLGAILLGHVFYNYSIVLRIVGSFWATLDTRLEQAAAVLGADRRRVFLSVTLPLLLPAIGAAALLVFIFTFGSFGIVLLLGGPRYATVEVEIYRQTTQLLRLEVAAALSLVQVAVTLLMTLAYTRLQARGAAPLERRGGTEPVRPGSWPARLLVGANVTALLLLIGAPLGALALRSVTALGPGDDGGLTLAYYRLLGENRRGSYFFVPPAQAIVNSLLFGLAATGLALLVGVPAAYLLARRRSPGDPRPTNHTSGWAIGMGPLPQRMRRALLGLVDPLFTLPLGVSAVTLGLGYIVALGPLGALRWPWLIPVAHALLAFPFVVRSLLPALRALDDRLREAAQVLGAPPTQVLRAIDLPLLLPSLLVGAVFSFTVSLGDFGAALLLARPEYPTVPVVIGRLLGQPGAENYGQALALSTILMLIATFGFVALERLGYRERGEL